MDLSDQAWVFLAADVTALGGIAVAWIQWRKPAKKLGNGFADRVEESQERTEKALEEIRLLAVQARDVAMEARDEIRTHKDAHVNASLRSAS